ncbi:hypothetical protein [Flavobacterium sp. UBA6195]|uniref:hypothetical protein n=1 Tax=Flavobacterium sp. UBA6195 TaxID=1946554 RepID=UPI0025BF0BB6|nr:hypothetical protein [Flavobacterium sp. UBA6195]
MRKILVYDDKNYIYRLIKFNIESEEIQVTRIKKNYFPNVSLSSFDYIFFVYYNEFNIIDFIDYFEVNKNIIVLYENHLFLEVFSNTKTVFPTINLNLHKREIILLINEIIS